jgi:hypothetical protein
MTPGVVIGVTWRVIRAIVNAWLEPNDITTILIGRHGFEQKIINNE